MRTVVFLLCCSVITKASNVNTNTVIRSQVNIQISASNVNTIVNHSVHHGQSSVTGTNKTRHTRRAGELSKKKCEEYYPPIPQPQNTFNGGGGYPYTPYIPYLSTPRPPLISDGKQTLAKEFPHMALIGLMKDSGFDRWICGGSLISHHFVLTAAHCLISKKLVVRLGELDTATETDDANPQDFTIKKSFPHPEYKTGTLYHDIGLIELDTPVTLTQYIGIACLDNRRKVNENEMLSITGWGQTKWRGPVNSYLLKAAVFVNPHNVCNNSYKNYSMLPFGIVDETQICAVGTNREDTCQGDSGGPLQAFSKFHEVTPVYNIVGVTSFGPTCGYSSKYRPGVYTRVHHYISWIENIVWPQTI